jgi:hypothetical protein
MFGKLRGMFSKRPQPVSFTAAVEQAAREAMAEVNWDDPAERTGVSLYFVLSKQFDLIGKREGVFPYTPPFASDKARGALLGTAIAITRREYGEIPDQAVVDSAVAAFTLAYGQENGRFYALQTLKDSANGNEEVNFASDWAIKDTDGSIDENSPATPAAFYLAVAEMI